MRMERRLVGIDVNHESIEAVKANLRLNQTSDLK